MMSPILALENIDSRKGEFTLRVERLALEEGNVYALTGPNGSGKSTLLRIMALLEAPAGGTLCYAGAEVSGYSARRRMRQELSLVDQAPYLFTGTVHQNLAYGLKLRGVQRHEQRLRIAEALALLGITELDSRHVSELSTGEARRVALARAVVLNVRLLLLDEPTANVDNDSLPKFEALVQSLRQRGTTVVFATHDPALPERLNAKVIALNAGRIEPARAAGLAV